MPLTTLQLALPLILSFLLGWLTLGLLFQNRFPFGAALRAVLAMGLGWGMSAELTFFSLWAAGRFQPGAVIVLHLLLIAGLAVISRELKFIALKIPTFRKPSPADVLVPLVLLLAGAGVVMEARHYPSGGWDAWSVWNFKAKFILSAGTEWTNLFDPALWRSSPHYPLLVPLLQVWGWSLTGAALPAVPLLNALLMTGLTVALLWLALRDLSPETSPWIFALAPILLLCNSLWVTLAASQYGDIVVAFYLLAAGFCVLKYQRQPHTGLLLLCGICCGFLAFVKSEGQVAALILLGLLGLNVLWRERKNFGMALKSLSGVGLGVMTAGMAAGLFTLGLAPDNQTFINGLTSQDQPSQLFRFQMILAFIPFELISQKWAGIWYVVVGGIVLGGKRLIRKDLLIIPLFLLAYGGVIIFYYWLNTYFDIGWWMQVSLHRLLFALLPITFLWLFTLHFGGKR